MLTIYQVYKNQQKKSEISQKEVLNFLNKLCLVIEAKSLLQKKDLVKELFVIKRTRTISFNKNCKIFALSINSDLQNLLFCVIIMLYAYIIGYFCLL